MPDVPEQAEQIQRALQKLILTVANASDEQAKAMDADDDITTVLSNLFELVALLTRGKPERKWTADRDHPGFLVSNGDGGTMVAPFHLVADLPSGDPLEDIRAIAAEIRLCAGSALCLSGSIVLLGDPHYVGDLDFCEYIRLSERSASLDRLATLAEHAGSLPICTKIKLGAAERLTRPWVEPVVPASLDGLLGPCPEGGHGKSDVIALRTTTGPIEATNLMVWVPDHNPDDYAAAHSFPFQEVDPGTGAFIAVPWVPRRLARPSSIHACVCFLRAILARTGPKSRSRL